MSDVLIANFSNGCAKPKMYQIIICLRQGAGQYMLLLLGNIPDADTAAAGTWKKYSIDQRWQLAAL